ncbi:hypothetical protein HYPSUDRAFT_103313, partial [Hypholoma sublateritium FD-334 SS-4]
QGYLLHNEVTHARLLPREAEHAFRYPTLSLLVSLEALERGHLDLGRRGWIFGYGRRWGSLTGLRAAPYLTPGAWSIRGKLEGILAGRGYLRGRLLDAWMMTMPSFLGFEGINPLTVYFCYDKDGAFWLTVLEIHNTFGESHVHVLEAGRDEDETAPNGSVTDPIPCRYDHQWTFRRQFHVSPFNDRSGFYTVSIKSPTHPPMARDTDFSPPPKPAVRVHLYTASADDPTQRGALKLTALLRPTHATPLTARSLLVALAQAPFALLLTFPRILYVAGILHYAKRLDVYLRPDPQPAAEGWSADPPAGGVKWLEEGLIERFARRRVEAFLARRAEETGTAVELVSADPHVARRMFKAGQGTAEGPALTVSYTSPRFFSTLFLCPSAQHALLLGCYTENIFRVSDRALFLATFASAGSDDNDDGVSWLQRMRCRSIPRTLSLPVPNKQFLDADDVCSNLASGMVILTHHALDWLEGWIFRLARARVVDGQEPWKLWERA